MGDFRFVDWCNFKGLVRFISTARDEILKDIIRCRVEAIFREPCNKLAEVAPHLSDEEFRIVGHNLAEFYKKNLDISDVEFRNIAMIVPLALVAVWPKIEDKNLQILFQIILEEHRDHGKMFSKHLK